MELCVTKIQAMRDRMEKLQVEVYNLMATTAADMNRITVEDDADMGLLCREMEELFDEMRKEVKARKELCGKIIAMDFAKRSLAGDVNDKVSGEIATASPDVKQQPKIPKQGTDEFLELMEAVGVSKEVALSGAVKLDWNGMGDYVAKQVALGKKIPPGITKLYPVFVATFRRKHVKRNSDSE